MDSTGVDSDPFDGNSGLEPRDTAPDKGDTPPGEVPAASGGAPGSGGATGTGGRSGTGGIIGTGGVTGTGGGVSQPVKLDGTKFGTTPSWQNNPGTTFDKAFDGNTATFFDDSHETDGYTGIALAAPASVVSIRYYPRPGCNPPENCTNRMVGGKFQCSATSQTTGYTDLHTIPAAPAVAWTEVKLAQPATCRYLRYLGPTKGYTNVAEIEFWGQQGQ